MKLWTFVMDDGTQVWSRTAPPGWSESMRKAHFTEAPDDISAEFQHDAMLRFWKEYGAPLHTVTVEKGAPPGTYKRNAKIC